MIICYDVSCFERELKIIFPDGYEEIRQEIEQILNDAYCKWHSPEDIEDFEERMVAEDSCCEEYMIDKLSGIYNIWDEWISEYYGNDPEEMEDEIDWIINPLREK